MCGSKIGKRYEEQDIFFLERWQTKLYVGASCVMLHFFGEGECVSTIIVFVILFGEGERSIGYCESL